MFQPRNLWFLNVRLNVNSMVKIWQLITDPWWRGPSHGTTGTMVNLAMITTGPEMKQINFGYLHVLGSQTQFGQVIEK